MSTIPTTVGPEHPAARAVHAVFDVLETAEEVLRDPALSGDAHAAATQIRKLLAETGSDIAALYQNNEALEADLRGLRDQGLKDAREITELRREVVRLSIALGEEMRERETLVESVSNGLAQMNEYFRQANRLRLEGARRDVAPTTTTNEPPQFAVAGA